MTTRMPTTLLALTLLAACGGDSPKGGDPKTDEPKTEEPQDSGQPDSLAVFADASPDALKIAAAAALNYLPAVAYMSTVPATADAVASDNTCPVGTVDDEGRITFSADACQAPSGSFYDGSLTGENLPDLFSETPPEGAIRIQFNGWTANGVSLDGEYYQSELAPTTDYSMTAALTVAIDGLPEVSQEVALDCTLDGAASSCTAESPMALSVAGLGDISVAGPWRMEDAFPTGSLSLVGEDTLVLDLDGMDPETACIPATVDGVAIDDICIANLLGGDPGDGGEQPETDTQIMGSVISPVNDELEVTIWTLGEDVAAIDAEVRVNGGSTELHSLDYIGLNPLDEDTWSVFLVEGDYVPGESSAFLPFEESDVILAKIRAFDADGNVLACHLAGGNGAPPEEHFSWEECPSVW